MNSIVEILSLHSQNNPEGLFCVGSNEKEYTYSEAWKKIKCVAEVLRSKFNIKETSCVMAEANQSAEFLIVDLACELLGAIFIPVEDVASNERIKTILNETKSVLFVFSKMNIEKAKRVSYDEIINSESEIINYQFPKADSIAEILYTTGTTGKSKGIAISNKANVALAENIKYGVHMKPNNTEFVPVPISHSHGIRCCYANILNGGTIILSDGLMNVKRTFSLFNKYNITSMDLTPTATMIMIKVSKGLFWEYAKNLDYIQIGTAVLPENLKKDLVQNLQNVRLYNFYGSTESGRSCVIDFNKDNIENCIGNPQETQKSFL